MSAAVEKKVSPSDVHFIWTKYDMFPSILSWIITCSIYTYKARQNEIEKEK
jgi:hypothetical protein